MNIVRQAHQNYTQQYIDDVIIFPDSWEDHGDHVRALIQEFKDRNFTFWPDKCKFGDKLRNFLGHVFGSETHVPDDEQIEE